VTITFPQEKSLLDFPGVAIAQRPIRSLVAAMTPEELFTAALGLGPQWRVVECRFEGEPKRLELRLEHVRGQHFECPQCGTLCGVHDTIDRGRQWYHSASKANGSGIQELRLLQNRRLPPSRQAQLGCPKH
jgi:hypothetical protein